MVKYLGENWVALAALLVSVTSALVQWGSSWAQRPRIGVYADGMIAYETHLDTGGIQSHRGAMVYVKIANLGDRPLRLAYVHLVLVKAAGWDGDTYDLDDLFVPQDEVTRDLQVDTNRHLDELLEPQHTTECRLWIGRGRNEHPPLVRVAVEVLSGKVAYSRIVFTDQAIDNFTPGTPSLLRRKWEDLRAKRSAHLSKLIHEQEA